jgi:hypothetical protein
MEAVSSLETSVHFYQFERRYIPDDGAVHSHSYESLNFLLTKITETHILFAMKAC